MTQRSPREPSLSPAKAGFSGDGGNRTHVVFPPSEHQLLPITSHRGQIHSYALVDAADFARLAEYRWHVDNRRWGLVARKERVDGKLVRRMLHREVLGLEPGDPRHVDHINRNTLDNRRANLRLATTAENAQNQGSRGGSSKYRGVTWDKSRDKWMATVMLNGRRKTLGRFDSEDEAGRVAAEYRREHMPYSEEGINA